MVSKFQIYFYNEHFEFIPIIIFFQCLDKKRIKMKQGETLALNERIMLSLVSTGHDCPFIVCMTYAFHTADKLCFILDLMNGGDLHYHLSQVG